MIAIVAASLVHVAISGGFGAAHGVVGPQLEVRYGHLGFDAGVGFLDAPYLDVHEGFEPHISPVLGLRYFFAEAGDAAFLSFHASYFSDLVGVVAPNAEYEQRDRYVFAAMVGYRLRPSSGLFLDLGIGLGLQILHRYGQKERPPAGPGIVSFDETHVAFGWIWGTPAPPILFAIGYEF